MPQPVMGGQTAGPMAHRNSTEKSCGEVRNPHCEANLPAVVFESCGSFGNNIEQVSAVPTHALPIVSGICGTISMMKATQRSFSENDIKLIFVGPRWNSVTKTPKCQTRNDPHPDCGNGGRQFLIV